MELTLEQVYPHIPTLVSNAMFAIDGTPHDHFMLTSKDPTYVQVGRFYQVDGYFETAGGILRQIVGDDVPANIAEALRMTYVKPPEGQPNPMLVSISTQAPLSSDGKVTVNFLDSDPNSPMITSNWLEMADDVSRGHYGKNDRHVQFFAMFHLANGEVTALKFNSGRVYNDIADELINAFPEAEPVLVQVIDGIVPNHGSRSKHASFSVVECRDGYGVVILHLVEGPEGLKTLFSNAPTVKSAKTIHPKSYADYHGACLFKKLLGGEEEPFAFGWKVARLNLVGFADFFPKLKPEEEHRTTITLHPAEADEWSDIAEDWIESKMSKVWRPSTLIGMITDPVNKEVTLCFGNKTLYHPASVNAWTNTLQMASDQTSSDTDVITIRKRKSLRKYRKVLSTTQATLDEVMEKIRTHTIVPVHFQVEKGGNEVILHVVDFA